MKWKQLAIAVLWISGVLLAMFPEVCVDLGACNKSPFTLILIIGVIGGILILSDAKKIKKEVLENMDKHLKDSDKKSTEQDKQKIPK